MLSFLLTACKPSQQITGLWVNREALPEVPFNYIFMLILKEDKNIIYRVEDDVASLIAACGAKVVKSNDIFPPKFTATTSSKEQMAEAIKRFGCEVIFTIAVLDTKTIEHYKPGTNYFPMALANGAYNNYYTM
jgi:hypothetical protein